MKNLLLIVLSWYVNTLPYDIKVQSCHRWGHKKEKKKGTIKSKNLTVKKVKKETTNSKQVILRCEIQKMNEQGMSFEKIADRFGVDKDVY